MGGRSNSSSHCPLGSTGKFISFSRIWLNKDTSAATLSLKEYRAAVFLPMTSAHLIPHFPGSGNGAGFEFNGVFPGLQPDMPGELEFAGGGVERGFVGRAAHETQDAGDVNVAGCAEQRALFAAAKCGEFIARQLPRAGVDCDVAGVDADALLGGFGVGVYTGH